STAGFRYGIFISSFMANANGRASADGGPCQSIQNFFGRKGCGSSGISRRTHGSRLSATVLDLNFCRIAPTGRTTSASTSSNRDRLRDQRKVHMDINRRQLLSATSLGVSTLAAAASKLPDFSSIRNEFPRATQQVYLDAAANMPLPKFVAEGMRRYMDFHMYGPGQGRGQYASESLRQVKPLFAKLINAKASEIGFVVCTKAGEAAIVNGLRIQESGGNLVTNDLHYAGSIHDYIGRRKAGMDLRIVKHRDWRIDLRDMEKVVDKKTKLVSITLVSNVNGWVEDAKAISALAHAHGAFAYADMIQAVGSVPVDVKALDIDFAACSNYKWLQGARGAGFLYVREELQGSKVKDLSFPGYVNFNYSPWVAARNSAADEFPYAAPKN